MLVLAFILLTIECAIAIPVVRWLHDTRGLGIWAARDVAIRGAVLVLLALAVPVVLAGWAMQGEGQR